MKLFEKLIQITTSAASLNIFLTENINEVIDFQNEDFETLKDEAELINKFITDKGAILRLLDYDVSHNKAFISILFDFCERFGFINTVRISSIISDNNIIIGHRLLSAKLYLLNIANNSDLINRFDAICTNLQFALENEEDNKRKIDLTFANYINYVVNNTSNATVTEVVKKINDAVLNAQYSFLSSDFIQSIIQINYFNHEVALLELQNLIEAYINETGNLIKGATGYLIEEDTDYFSVLERSSSDFNSIRRISINRLNVLTETERKNVHSDLLRGVKPLENENELFAYMVFFGPMHYAKLTTSFTFLPPDIFSNELNIIDWGCGQGMATMTLLELINSNDYSAKINGISLIEPSELALKRASLHVSKFNDSVSIQTINKYLDSLSPSDFKNKKSTIKIHLFSNILDIDLFSLSALIKLIDATFLGENYFVCVSPFVDDLKASRLDNFMKSFSKNINYQIIKSIDNKKGQWTGTTWARVVRVFKASI